MAGTRTNYDAAVDDDFPRWPPPWIEDRPLAAEEVLAEAGDIAFASALRADDRVLLSVSWPGGKRWLMVDPVGNEAPQALRIGERSEDPEISRMVEGVWSQALTRAKQLMDGELDLGAEGPGETPDPPAGPRRRWRRGQG